MCITRAITGMEPYAPSPTWGTCGRRHARWCVAAQFRAYSGVARPGYKGEGVGPTECMEGLGADCIGGNIAPQVSGFGRAGKLGAHLAICWSYDFHV